MSLLQKIGDLEKTCRLKEKEPDCSNHIIENEKIFLYMDTTVTTKVCMGNGTIATTKRKANIVVDSRKV